MIELERDGELKKKNLDLRMFQRSEIIFYLFYEKVNKGLD